MVLLAWVSAMLAIGSITALLRHSQLTKPINHLSYAAVCCRWQGWEGHVTADPYTGLQFHNIKFKDERILYELALQVILLSGQRHCGSACVVYCVSHLLTWAV